MASLEQQLLEFALAGGDLDKLVESVQTRVACADVRLSSLPVLAHSLPRLDCKPQMTGRRAALCAHSPQSHPYRCSLPEHVKNQH